MLVYLSQVGGEAAECINLFQSNLEQIQLYQTFLKTFLMFQVEWPCTFLFKILQTAGA